MYEELEFAARAASRLQNTGEIARQICAKMGCPPDQLREEVNHQFLGRIPAGYPRDLYHQPFYWFFPLFLAEYCGVDPQYGQRLLIDYSVWCIIHYYAFDTAFFEMQPQFREQILFIQNSYPSVTVQSGDCFDTILKKARPWTFIFAITANQFSSSLERDEQRLLSREAVSAQISSWLPLQVVDDFKDRSEDFARGHVNLWNGFTHEECENALDVLNWQAAAAALRLRNSLFKSVLCLQAWNNICTLKRQLQESTGL